MASSTANSLDRLKDGNGNYIWRTGMTAGAPAELLGHKVEFDETMPTVAAGSLPIAFGDWKRGYLLVQKPGLRFLRDVYSDKPNIRIYCYSRLGGGVANSDAIKLMRIGTS